MFSSDAVNAILDLVTKTVVKMGQAYASLQCILAISRSGHVPSEIISTLNEHGEQRNIV